MSVSIKRLINERQRAFHSGLVPQWKTLKYKVQTEISLRKKEYYRNKVQHLRKDDCRKWWQIVNKMSGRSQRDGKLVFEKDGRLLSDLELADNLNKYYISVNMDIVESGGRLLIKCLVDLRGTENSFLKRMADYYRIWN